MDMESSSTGRTNNNNNNDNSPSHRPVQTVTLEETTPKHQTPMRFKEADNDRSCLAQGLASNSPIARRLENVHLRSPDFDDMDLSFQSTPRGGGEATPRRDEATAASPLGDTATPPAESEQDRRRRQEEEESIALARLLMAQEAMESYALSADYLRYNASQYSQEDMQALQALLAEEEEASDEAPDTDNYEMMLRLGESIGDVKTDRWRMVAHKHMADLPTFCFTEDMAKGLGENDTRRKCQVCQCDYETDETVKSLPCGHCFHSECVDQWLKENDCCAYCRKPILDGKGDTNTGTGSI